MNIFGDVLRGAIVDHMSYIFNVDTPGHNIGAHQYFTRTLFQIDQGFFALLLRFLPMNKGHLFALSRKVIVKRINFGNQIHKDDYWWVWITIEHTQKFVASLLVIAHKFKSLIYGLFVANFANLNECRKFKILLGHLFN